MILPWIFWLNIKYFHCEADKIDEIYPQLSSPSTYKKATRLIRREDEA